MLKILISFLLVLTVSFGQEISISDISTEGNYKNSEGGHQQKPTNIFSPEVEIISSERTAQPGVEDVLIWSISDGG